MHVRQTGAVAETHKAAWGRGHETTCVACGGSHEMRESRLARACLPDVAEAVT